VILVGLCILLVIGTVLFYYGWWRLYGKSNDDAVPSKLNLQEGPVIVPKTKMHDLGQSNKVTYDMWVYISVYPIVDTTLFSQGKLKVQLLKSTPSIKITYQDTEPSSFVLPDNCPVQSWFQLIVSIDSTIIDVYVNGKLSASKKATQIVECTNDDLTLGDPTNPQITLVKCNRSIQVMDPMTANRLFLLGSSSSSLREWTLWRDHILQNDISSK
jgi:hypothetical protein